MLLPQLLVAFSLATTGAPATKTLTVKDSGKTVTIAASQRLQIKLSECGSCGYQWKTTTKPATKVLTTLKQTHSEPPECSTPPCPVGGNTTTLFRYAGKASGKTTLKLEYFGPGKTKSSKTFRLTVKVR